MMMFRRKMGSLEWWEYKVRAIFSNWFLSSRLVPDLCLCQRARARARCLLCRLLWEQVKVEAVVEEMENK